MKKTEEEIYLNQTNLKKTNGDLTFAMIEMDKKNKEIEKQSDTAFVQLDQLKCKYYVQRDMNLMFRQFYEKNVVGQQKKDKLVKNMEQGLKNFNKALSKKDNFIADNMDELEEIVNAKKLLPDELIIQLFGDLDAEIAIEME